MTLHPALRNVPTLLGIWKAEVIKTQFSSIFGLIISKVKLAFSNVFRDLSSNSTRAGSIENNINAPGAT